MNDRTDKHLEDLTARTPVDDVLDRLIADNDRLLAMLNEIIDVEAGLQDILDRGHQSKP